MITLAPALVAASAAIILLPGLIHLLYTFRVKPLCGGRGSASMQATAMARYFSGWSTAISRSHTARSCSRRHTCLASACFYWAAMSSSHDATGSVSQFRGIVAATILYVAALIVNGF